MTQAKIIEVIEVETCQGLGTTEDPCRTVLSWFKSDGHEIGHFDPLEKP